MREWCVNTAAVDPATSSILVNNEDGRLYRWHLPSNALTQSVRFNNGYAESYTPTAIGAGRQGLRDQQRDAVRGRAVGRASARRENFGALSAKEASMNLAQLFIASLLLFAVDTASVAQAPPAGQATGSLTAKGKTVKLTYAAAFVDETDKKKPVILLLTEQPVPSASWKSHSDLMAHHRATPIAGVVFRLDAQREVDTAEYFLDRFPTSTSGIFVVTFDGPPGRAFTGSARSTPTAAS